jgi:predicted kinase
MRTIICTRGIPGSGKSTWAKAQLAEEPGRWCRINKDDLRLMLYGASTYCDPATQKEREAFVHEMQEHALRTALRKGKDVILDNTHLPGDSMKRAHQVAEELGDVTVIERIFVADLDTCMKRVVARAVTDPLSYVPEDKIREMHAKFSKNLEKAALAPRTTVYPRRPEGQTAVQDPSLPEAVIVDLDGTSALMNGRNPYDAARCDEDLPNWPVILTVKAVHIQRGTKVLFVSGRDAKFREPTERFLQRYYRVTNMECVRAPAAPGMVIPYELFMRPEGDTRKDSLVKKEIYEREIMGKYQILSVYDDRDCVVRLWREELGLTCFQVGYGSF